jgi:hypothetical protein
VPLGVVLAALAPVAMTGLAAVVRAVCCAALDCIPETDGAGGLDETVAFAAGVVVAFVGMGVAVTFVVGTVVTFAVEVVVTLAVGTVMTFAVEVVVTFAVGTVVAFAVVTDVLMVARAAGRAVKVPVVLGAGVAFSPTAGADGFFAATATPLSRAAGTGRAPPGRETDFGVAAAVDGTGDTPLVMGEVAVFVTAGVEGFLFAVETNMTGRSQDDWRKAREGGAVATVFVAAVAVARVV